MAIIKVKIDVTKIDKARLFAGKNGAKYLDCTLLGRDETDQYGNDFMVVQDVTKEERLAGVKGAILGNAKHMEARQASTPRSTRAATSPAAAASDDDSQDIPF